MANLLLDPVGHIADIIAICNAFGIKTPAQRAESEEFMNEIQAIQDGVNNLRDQIAMSEKKIKEIKGSMDVAMTVLIRERLSNNLSIRSGVLDSTIKLLLMLKRFTAIVTFAVVIRYDLSGRTATLGLAGSTNDNIHDIFNSLDRLAGQTKDLKLPKTTYVSARCRGKQDLEAESHVTSTLCCLVAVVLGVPSVGGAESMESCKLEPEPGKNKTVVLLRSKAVEREKPEYDRFCRIFLVGDTRTGKSSLGNALTGRNTFKVSKGMTGTLHIGCEEILDTSLNCRGFIEVYDTPGLNDKDQLDVYYQAAIEDKIVALQQANALVLTIAVDAGITDSARRAIEQYKDLFGRKMEDMVIFVLTRNDSADKEACEGEIEFNWNTIVGLIKGIRKSNVKCVSLEDLRCKETSYSHTVVRELLTTCQNMPLKIIDSLSTKYEKIRDSLLQKKGEVQHELDEMMKDGWTAYEELTDSFESAPDTAVVDLFMNGFVYKQTGSKRKFMAIASLGIFNFIRKFAIHVEFTEPQGRQLWKQFLEGDLTDFPQAKRIFGDMLDEKGLADSPQAMRLFGDMVDEKGLAVLVKAGKPTMCGTLRVQRSYVTVFNPEYKAREIIAAFIEELQSKEKDIAPHVMDGLEKLAFPKTRGKRLGRSRRDGSKKTSARSRFYKI